MKHAVKWHHVSVYERCHQGVVRQEGGKGEGFEGKLKNLNFGSFAIENDAHGTKKLLLKTQVSEDFAQINARAVSRGQKELVWKFKMVAGDILLECMCTP